MLFLESTANAQLGGLGVWTPALFSKRTKVPFLQCPLYFKKSVFLRLKRHGSSHTISSVYETAKQYSKVMSSVKSFSVPFFVDWTPVLKNSFLRLYWYLFCILQLFQSANFAFATAAPIWPPAKVVTLVLKPKRIGDPLS